jgi:hypothetical protein
MPRGPPHGSRALMHRPHCGFERSHNVNTRVGAEAAGTDLPHFMRRLLQLSHALERPPTPTMCKLHIKIGEVMNV